MLTCPRLTVLKSVNATIIAVEALNRDGLNQSKKCGKQLTGGFVLFPPHDAPWVLFPVEHDIERFNE